ncbi:hypothetical protein M5G25_19000 [Pseudomonas sp. TNT2022 ID357]|uniref:Uncharacterized protein n=2 Tax=Pseudomonas idahonensis TaxID=2942628 RepID=A0ABT5Q848_9PSED|nr:hypothetical protein [Pseudomonas idahonensis]MDD1150371.1 hypothetical protein [Pseudomonas idahonensis]
MRVLTAFTLLLLVGQAAAGEQVISVQHDSQRGVTCWIIEGTGISCLPDSSLNPRQDAATTGPDSEAARASLATSMCQNEQLSTTTTQGDERFQL